MMCGIASKYLDRSAGLLDNGQSVKLVISLRSTDSSNAEILEKIRTEGITLSAMPSACNIPSSATSTSSSALVSSKPAARPSLGSRLKQSGMFWTVRGANSIIGLALLSPQRSLRGLLGEPPSGLTPISMSRAHNRTSSFD
jgi:hypothetical protein